MMVQFSAEEFHFYVDEANDIYEEALRLCDVPDPCERMTQLGVKLPAY